MDALFNEEKEILFSVIIVNKILEAKPESQAFSNILEQSIGFEEHIQIVFVDETPYSDISDEWKTIIEDHSSNIDYIQISDIHSITANGLAEYIRGQYFIYDWDENNYLRNAFSEMKNFIDAHAEETSVFYMKENADSVAKSKLINYPDKNGIFYLINNPDLLRLDGGSVVLSKSVLEFDEIKNVSLSDYFFLTIYQVACVKTINVGICNRSVCRYTKEYAEYKYSTRVAHNRLEAYEKEIFDNYHKKVLSVIVAEMKFCPLFFQRLLCTDLIIRTLPQRKGKYAELDTDELREMERQIGEVLNYIEDDAILTSKIGFSENKANLLRLKYGSYPDIITDKKNVFLHYGNTFLQSMAEMAFSLDFLSIEDGMLSIEGQFLYFGLADEYDDQIKVFASVNGVEWYDFECQKRSIGGKYTIGGREVQKCLWFKTQIYLSRLVSDYEIEFYLKFNDTKIMKKVTAVSRFFPIEPKLDKSYYYDNEWRAYFKSNKLMVSYTNENDLKVAEKEFCEQIEKKGNNGQSAANIRRLYFVIKDLKTRPIWLCSNRVTAGGNNGGVFFEYVRNNHPEIDSYFLLDNKCEEYNNLKAEGVNVVGAGSREHKLIFMLSDFNISSQFAPGVRNPFGDDYIFFRDFIGKEKFVYLQHGVIKDDMSWLNQKRNRNFYGHVVSAKAEYDSLENGIDFDDKNLWLTGLARFDKLHHDERKVICFSPTWRQWLMNPINEDGTRTPIMKEFKKSPCYQFYQGILNCKKLFDNAEKYGYEIWFCDHPLMRAYDNEIYSFDPRVKIVNEMVSDELNAQSDLMITDYSSAVFDFVYLRKPVLYFQFDKDLFFQNHTFVGEGYFDYESDGFGEVEYDMDSAVDRIIEYMESGCELKDKYRERIDKFFEFSDSNNCKRIYEHIVNSDAYRLYPLKVTNKPLLKLVDVPQLAKIISKNDKKTTPLDALIAFEKKSQRTENTEKIVEKYIEVERPVEKIIEVEKPVDYVSYVPERFYKGDLGFKAIVWCIKGWLSHRFKKEDKT